MGQKIYGAVCDDLNMNGAGSRGANLSKNQRIEVQLYNDGGVGGGSRAGDRRENGFVTFTTKKRKEILNFVGFATKPFTWFS